MIYRLVIVLCLILGGALGLIPSGALAAPRSVADCESITQALAYNNCLASFGPKMGQRRARAGVQSDREPPAGSIRNYRGRATAKLWRHKSGKYVSRKGAQRQQMQFNIIDESKK
jgi:hypothetical protein